MRRAGGWEQILKPHNTAGRKSKEPSGKQEGREAWRGGEASERPHHVRAEGDPTCATRWRTAAAGQRLRREVWVGWAWRSENASVCLHIRRLPPSWPPTPRGCWDLSRISEKQNKENLHCHFGSPQQPPYPQGYVQDPQGCLRPQMVPNPMYCMPWFSSADTPVITSNF